MTTMIANLSTLAMLSNQVEPPLLHTKDYPMFDKFNAFLIIFMAASRLFFFWLAKASAIVDLIRHKKGEGEDESFDHFLTVYHYCRFISPTRKVKSEYETAIGDTLDCIVDFDPSLMRGIRAIKRDIELIESSFLKEREGQIIDKLTERDSSGMTVLSPPEETKDVH